MSDSTIDKTVIITGGNSGLGFEAAKAIAQAHQGWNVVLACRSTERGNRAVDAISNETANDNVSMLQLDLASLDSVRAFVSEFQAKAHPPLMGLICNAGVLVPEGTQYTQDGFELTFGVNHLGHFLLTNLLLSQFGAPGRIVVVSSNTHNPGVREGRMARASYLGGQALAHPDPSQDLSGMHRYTTSKLCNLLFAYELDRRLHSRGANITVNAFDPGFSPGTNLGGERNLPRRIMGSALGRGMIGALGIVTSTPRRSGGALGRLVLDSRLEKVSGTYYQIMKAIPSSAASHDLEMAKELWETSMKLTGL